jgi:hypothetical protein
MNKPPEQLEQQIGQYLNQQSADLTIMKVTLQVLIWNLVRRDPEGTGMLGHLKNEVMASLYKSMVMPSTGSRGAAEAERLRQLTLIRAEKMFQEIEQMMGARAGSPASGAN